MAKSTGKQRAPSGISIRTVPVHDRMPGSQLTATCQYYKQVLGEPHINTDRHPATAVTKWLMLLHWEKEGRNGAGVSACWGSRNKGPQAGGLNNRNAFPPSSGGWKLRSKCQEGWFLPRSLSLAGRWLSSPKGPHRAVRCVSVSLSLLTRTQSYCIRATLVTSF